MKAKGTYEMTDILNAQDVEVVVDREGKLWVNIDGKCIVRVGRALRVTFDDPDRGQEVFEAKQMPIKKNESDLVAWSRIINKL